MRRTLGIAVLAILAGGCGGEPEPPRSLVLIVIDTLRADRTGAYGYRPAVTPTLDSLAAAGVRFAEVVAPTPVTLPSVATVLTGLYPLAHGVRDNGYFVLEDRLQTLAERFREAGFRTAAVVGSAVVGADRGLAQGFEWYDADFEDFYPIYREELRPYEADLAGTRRRADEVTDRAISFLENFRDSPYFLFVHYFDVHSHYDPPPSMSRLHPGRPYDGEVSFVDREIGRLMSRLPDPDRTLVVVTADHGESQGEHGEPQHGFLLYQATLRVPLLVAGPGVRKGLVRPDPVSLTDLEPTLAAEFDLPGDGSPRDGRVLSWNDPETEMAPIYAETFRTLVTYEWAELRSLRLGRWKLIRSPFDEELYDLQEDPGELENRTGTGPHAHLATLLNELTADDVPEEIYARARTARSPQSSEMLESLGYLGHDREHSAFPVDRKHPREELPRWLGLQHAKVLVGEAADLMRTGDVDRAWAVLDSARTLNPASADVRYLRGSILQFRNDPEGAHAEWDSALAIDPDHLHTLLTLAETAAREGDETSEVTWWTRVHEVDPENTRALRFLSVWYINQNLAEHALPHLRTLVRQSPDDAVARFNLGYAAFLSARDDEARRELEEFLRRFPKDPGAEEVRGWLAEIEARTGD